MPQSYHCKAELAPDKPLSGAKQADESLYLLAALTVNGPLWGLIQTLVPERKRATAIAQVYLSSNLIGMGLGPLAAGMLSDAFRPFVAEESLRYALMVLTP